MEANELGDDGEIDSESELEGVVKQTFSNAIPLSRRDLEYIGAGGMRGREKFDSIFFRRSFNRVNRNRGTRIIDSNFSRRLRHSRERVQTDDPPACTLENQSVYKS